jgi:hypothetical protein
MPQRTRIEARDGFFTNDDHASEDGQPVSSDVRFTARNLITAINEKDFATARYELESLAKYHESLEALMDEMGPEPDEGDDPLSNEDFVKASFGPATWDADRIWIGRTDRQPMLDGSRIASFDTIAGANRFQGQIAQHDPEGMENGEYFVEAPEHLAMAEASTSAMASQHRED